MKLPKPFLICVCFGLFLTACSPPDLTAEITSTESGEFRNNRIEIPLDVRISEMENETINTSFKVAVYYTLSNGQRFVGQFLVPGQENTGFPQVNVGASRSLSGTLIVENGSGEDSLMIEAEADTCLSPPIFSPDYCNVRETDEDNNFSTPVEVPILYPS